jgi:hypothetical protein
LCNFEATAIVGPSLDLNLSIYADREGRRRRVLKASGYVLWIRSRTLFSISKKKKKKKEVTYPKLKARPERSDRQPEDDGDRATTAQEWNITAF